MTRLIIRDGTDDNLHYYGPDLEARIVSDLSTANSPWIDLTTQVWEYPHEVQIVPPARRTLLYAVDVYRDVVKRSIRTHEYVRRVEGTIAIDLPWLAVGPVITCGLFNVCALLGFREDPRTSETAVGYPFPESSYGLVHHCLGGGDPKGKNFWSTTLHNNVDESERTEHCIEIWLGRMRGWMDRPMRGILTSVAP